MNEKTTHGLIMGGLALLLLFALFQVSEKGSAGENIPKISVSGMAEMEIMPNQAVLSLTVLTEGSDAKDVQDRNTQQMNTVIAALKEAGVDNKEIETTGYNLYPWHEWNPSLQKSVEKGYRVQQTITVTTKETTKAGELVDIAVKSGVNTVNGISFRLSTDREQEVREELVALASTKAREKAETLAKSLKVSLGDVLYATESSFNNGGWYSGGMAKIMAMEATSAPDIAPEQVKVSIQVNVDFEVD